MHVVLDEPQEGQTIATLPLRVRGWLWLGTAQAMVDAVEVWAGESRLGAVGALHARPDVATHLQLAPAEKVGFDLLVRSNVPATVGDLPISIRVKTTTGSLMGPFCTRQVRIASNHPARPTQGEVRIVMDRPLPSQMIDGSGLAVSGWVWLSGHQDAIAGVEAWSGQTCVGSTSSLFVRPDVSRSLGQDENVSVGFSFRAEPPAGVSEVPLALHVRLRDGTTLGPFCATSLRVGTDLAAALDTKTQELAAAHRVVAQLQQDIREVRAKLAQWESPIPPDHLQIRQTGSVMGPLFYEHGAKLSADIIDGFTAAGCNVRAAKRVLDFGCGCGRVLVGVRQHGVAGEIWGTDIDAESIAWNQSHIGKYAQFVTNEPAPPLRFPDSYFDAIYSVSVFTHLPEDMQFAWLAELRRVLAPGGIAVVSVHGRSYWQTIHPEVRQTVENRGFDYRSAQKTDGLPDFYMVAFHSATYLRQRWGAYFEVLGIKEQAIAGAHDAVLLRRAPS